METSKAPLTDEEKAALLADYSSQIVDQVKTIRDKAKLIKAQQKVVVESIKKAPKLNLDEPGEDRGSSGELTGMGQVAGNTRAPRPVSPEEHVATLQHDEKGWYRQVGDKKYYE